MNKKLALTVCIVLLSVITSQAYKMINIPDRAKTAAARVSTGDCVAGSSQTDLFINDVRARMLDDGDKWWDLNIAHYQVPQVAAGQTPVCSIFAGSIWIGGVDAGGQLKIAAATYRQNGNDWFPGPIPLNGQVNQTICSAFDNHWQVFGGEIDTFLNIIAPQYSNTNIVKGNPVITYNIPTSQIPQDILMWPGTGSTYNPVINYAPGRTLAPFADVYGSGVYDPVHGDYPIIQPSAIGGCNKPVYGDQMLWWCYNDLGNIHTETGGLPIGMQVNEEAWAYQTNDFINDMTFYHYRIINTANTVLDSVFMGQWVDPDLGCYEDDYVGCDSTRNLGIDYNGEAVDGPCTPNYGDQPPLVGTTYFQGPTYSYRPHPNSKTDTLIRDTTLKMTSFIWYNNDFTAIGNPVGASQYYGYLSGTWKDGTPFTFGGDGHGGTQPFKYMFPSDPPDNTSGAWSECEAHDVFGDRRYLQASGPFTLQPGAVSDIVVGAVWVRPPIGTYPCPSFLNTIDPASDEAQALFDGCFQIVNGPNAPDVTITELNKELVLNLVNTNNTNVEGYRQVDPEIKVKDSLDDTYTFEGYQIYQLLNNQVAAANYGDISQAKLIAECDVKDGVGEIINYIFDADLDGNVPTIMVNGADQGIKHTFDITTDAFAQGTAQLVNFQPYYFSVISYAYNKYKKIDTTGYIVDSATHQKDYVTTVDSNLLPYLAGRLNIAIYTGIPHESGPEANGTTINSVYGEGPFITREEGQGNGGNTIDLTQATISAIFNSSSGFINHPTYKQGEGPVIVKVIDPKRVPADSFSLSLYYDDTGLVAPNPNLDSSYTKWLLTNITTGDTINSDTTIAYGNEQLIPQWGISIYINQVLGPGYNTLANNGFISSGVVYTSARNQWLSGLVNQSPPSSFHWILSGTDSTQNKLTGAITKVDYIHIDDNMVYAGVIGGTWAPYVMCSPKITYTPVWADVPTNGINSSNYPGNSKVPPSKLAGLNSIDVVFTPDSTKWSRCVVVEENNEKFAGGIQLSQGGVAKMSLRDHASWDGGIDGNGNPIYNTSGSMGLSYFPGYAINLETGQRLNIFFGEDSYLISENGGDMLWNPTSNEFSPVGDTLLGGQHYIYVSSTQYDGCNAIYNALIAGNKRAVYSNIEWTGMTYLSPGSTMLPLSQGLIPGVATVQIRIAKPYALFTNMSDSTPVYNFGLKQLAADTDNTAMAKNALDSIEVVPNPYYAYSSYEQSALDNEIKFTNLPQVCTISIYTLDGQLVNTINYTGPYEEGKLNNVESTNWNLTNTNGVPIASGVYLIYFSSPGLGTHCIKWFGVRRPIDVSNF
jgi:hypothetical protein